MGAKRGLGATKIQTNFEDIEREAQLADSMRSQAKPNVPNVEDAEAQVASAAALTMRNRLSYILLSLGFQMSSLKLTYQDLSVESKKQAEKLQKTDPSKAQHLERLGMGILASTSSGPR